MITYDQGLAMAKTMKAYDPQIKDAILMCQINEWGVVALKFSDGCQKMKIEILDEPLGDDVRVYPG